MQQQEQLGRTDRTGMFCQKISKETGDKCGGLIQEGKCVRCYKQKPYAPYETLEDAIIDVVNKSKKPLQSCSIASIIEGATDEKRKPSKMEMQLSLRGLGDKLYSHYDPHGSSRQYYWHKPFELQNYMEMAKPLKQVQTLESYVTQRGISKKAAKKELATLKKAGRAHVCKIDSEKFYAANVKTLLYHAIKLKPGLNDVELAAIVGSKEQYVCRRLRELADEGLIYAEKPCAKRFVGRYKWHAAAQK